MNTTSLITLPIRLGLAAARRTIEIANTAGRLVGLGGGADDAQAAAAEAVAEPVVKKARSAPRKPARSASSRSGAGAKRRPATRGARAAAGAAKAKRPSTRRASGAAKPTAATKVGAPSARESAPVAETSRPSPVAETPAPPAGLTEPPAVEPAPPAAVEPTPAAPEPAPPTPEPSEAPGSPQAVPTAPERVTGIERRFTPSEPTNGGAHSDAEPSPTELAERGEGRQPAPLGSHEPGGDSPRDD